MRFSYFEKQSDKIPFIPFDFEMMRKWGSANDLAGINADKQQYNYSLTSLFWKFRYGLLAN